MKNKSLYLKITELIAKFNLTLLNSACLVCRITPVCMMHLSNPRSSCCGSKLNHMLVQHVTKREPQLLLPLRCLSSERLTLPLHFMAFFRLLTLSAFFLIAYFSFCGLFVLSFIKNSNVIQYQMMIRVIKKNNSE